MADVSLHLGDCLDVLKTLDANSIDSIVCDPPYGLSFMGKDWDHGVPGVAFWEAALRVAKPGAMLLAFGGTRTFHRLAVAIEDAGWQIRDCLTWLYGSGFPKSHDIGKAIDKAAGAERPLGDEIIYADGKARKVGANNGHAHQFDSVAGKVMRGTAPATPAAQQWDGWGTALKPAWEPVIMARKPLEGTVAANVLKWGVGGLNVDACRIESGVSTKRQNYASIGYGGSDVPFESGSDNGRWPANLLLDEEAAELLDEQSGTLHTHAGTYRREKPQGRAGHIYGAYEQAAAGTVVSKGDTGGASRFFYVAKASKRDRDEGLEGMEERVINITEGHGRGAINTSKGDGTGIRENRPRANHHPTVKPTQLMRYLCRLVTPPNGVILDPFMGSGSTGKAAVMEGFNFIGIEIDKGYYDIAAKRIAEAQMQLPLLEMA